MAWQNKNIFSAAVMLLGLIFLLTACGTTDHRDTPLEVPKGPPSRANVVATDSSSFSPQMACLKRSIEVYRQNMVEPLRIHVASQARSGEQRSENLYAELSTRLDSQMKAAILELDPRRVRLVEASPGNLPAAADYTVSLYTEITRIDRGILSKSKQDQASFDYKSLGIEASRGEDVGVTSIGLAARLMRPDGSSVPLPVHPQLSAEALYRVQDFKYGVGLLGGALGKARSEVVVEGSGGITKLMAQQIVFTVVSRYLTVPGHRCLGNGAMPDDDWLAIFNGRLDGKSDTEVIVRMQETLIESGADIQMSGKVDAPTIAALGRHAGPLTAASGKPIWRKTLLTTFRNVFMEQPLDVNIVLGGRARVQRPGTHLQGMLTLDLKAPVTVILDDKKLDLPPCAATSIALPVGDHRLVIAAPSANDDPRPTALESGRLTIEANMNVTRKIQPPLKAGSGTACRTPKPAART